MPASDTPIDTAAARADRRLGILLVTAAAVAWSVSGIFARLLSVDMWTATCLRSIIGGVYMAIGLALVHRGRSLRALTEMGRAGWLVAVCGCIFMISFVGAFFHTSVANVSVIYATTPFIAAALGRVVLGEIVPARTLIAAAIALVGIAIMVSGSFGAGHLLGDALALAMASSFAVAAVLIRAKRSLEMLPVNLVTCIMAAVISWPMASPATAAPLDWLALAGFAFTSIALAFFMFLSGARRIPAAEAGLITTLEVVLSPLWVYLLFAENPGLAAIAGGAVVFAAVVWHIAGDLARR